MVDGPGAVDSTQVAVKKGTDFSSDGLKLTIGKKTVTATPDAGCVFKGWDPDKGKVDKDITVIANFQKSASTITFYFTDNFDNDNFECEDMYNTDCKAIIPGVWIDADG